MPDEEIVQSANVTGTQATLTRRVAATLNRTVSRLRPKRKPNDSSEVSLCMKYSLFAFNFIIWVLGGVLIGVSAWAWNISGISNAGALAGTNWLDPMLAILLIGILMFLLGFCGCLGSLRENIILLVIYYISLTVLLIIFLVVGIVLFALRNKLETSVRSSLHTMIVRYRDDSDLQLVIDWAQGDWLHCCGVDGPDDWNNNMYFNCSSTNSPEACGVPYTCCDHSALMLSDVSNTQCGYGSRINSPLFLNIYQVGCMDTAKTWLNKNMIPIAGALVGIALLMILGICFGCSLHSDINAQKLKWKYQPGRRHKHGRHRSRGRSKHSRPRTEAPEAQPITAGESPPSLSGISNPACSEAQGEDMDRANAAYSTYSTLLTGHGGGVSGSMANSTPSEVLGVANPTHAEVLE